MSEVHEILRIFVASPSGLDQERKAISEIVGETNRRNSSYWQLQFKVIGWEDTVGGNRRAQDIINRDLETCDYFFGIMADHWGSPPQSEGDVESKYTSGFHEEFELARRLFEKGKMKDILLFFKDIPADRLRDTGPSLQKVLDFRKKVRDERKPLYTEFDKLEVFKAKIGDALSKIGWEATTPRVVGAIVAPSDGNAGEMVSQSEGSSVTKKYFLSQATREFLRDVNNRSGDHKAVTNIDVARLRLISLGIHRPGNDDVYIGVHDANLLYRHRVDLNLSETEKRTLLAAGLRYLETSNVPFWYWTGGDVRRLEWFIQARMVSRDESISSAALKVGRLLGYSIPTFGTKLDRSHWIKRWLGEESAQKVRNAAQRHLSRWAEDDDVPVLQEVRGQTSGQQASNLDCIIVGIWFRHSETDGVNELSSRNPEQISSELQELLQDRVQGFSSDVLQGFARLKAEYVRLVGVKELVCRNALSEQLAQELSADNSIDVRLEAIKALADKAVPVAEDRAREALVVTAANRGFSGLFGVGRQTNDTSRFDDYQRHLLKKKTVDELLALEKESTPYKAEALLAAFQVFPGRTGGMLRGLLTDGFEGRFEERLGKIAASSWGQVADLAKDARDLKDFCCLKQTRAALDILAVQQKRKDLALVRHVLDRTEIEATEEVLAYLSRFGVWEDVERILALKVTGVSGATLVTDSYATNQELIGVALLKVGGSRFVDLLDTIKVPAIKASVIKASTRKVFGGLSNDKVLELMNEEDHGARKVTALRCVESLRKSRIVELLDKYIERDEYRYYNVIHWLDVGVTMPTSVARTVVQEELKSA